MKRMPAKRAPVYLALRYGVGGRIDTAEFAAAGYCRGTIAAGYTGAYQTADACRRHAQISATTQPMNVQPKNRLTRKIAAVFGWRRNFATRVGRKSRARLKARPVSVPKTATTLSISGSAYESDSRMSRPEDQRGTWSALRLWWEKFASFQVLDLLAGLLDLGLQAKADLRYLRAGAGDAGGLRQQRVCLAVHLL